MTQYETGWAYDGENKTWRAPASTVGQSDGRIGEAESKLALVQTGEWTSWTPTLGADTTPPTLGASPTQLGRYTRVGRTVIGDFIIYFGGAGLAAGTGSYRFNLPFLPVWNVDHRAIGNGYLFDASANDLKTFQLVVSGGATYAYGIVHSGGGLVAFVGAATYPWAVGDRLLGNFTYEAVT